MKIRKICSHKQSVKDVDQRKICSYHFHRSTNGERDELMRGRGRELMTNSTRYHSFTIIVVTMMVHIVFLGHNAIIVFRKLQETFKSRVQIVLFQFAPGCLISIIYQIGRETNLL